MDVNWIQSRLKLLVSHYENYTKKLSCALRIPVNLNLNTTRCSEKIAKPGCSKTYWRIQIFCKFLSCCFDNILLYLQNKAVIYVCIHLSNLFCKVIRLNLQEIMFEVIFKLKKKQYKIKAQEIY